jgi:hypothetical protein
LVKILETKIGKDFVVMNYEFGVSQ